MQTGLYATQLGRVVVAVMLLSLASVITRQNNILRILLLTTKIEKMVNGYEMFPMITAMTFKYHSVMPSPLLVVDETIYNNNASILRQAYDNTLKVLTRTIVFRIFLFSLKTLILTFTYIRIEDKIVVRRGIRNDTSVHAAILICIILAKVGSSLSCSQIEAKKTALAPSTTTRSER